MTWYFFTGWLVISIVTAAVLLYFIRRDKLYSGED